MAKARLVGIIFCCLVATTGWAATSSPSLMATPPQPKWSDLTVQQKIVLAPLSDDWDSLEYYRQKKWLNIVAHFHAMSAEEQTRIQAQMQEWGKLTPQQRQEAREKFKTASRLPAEKKKELKQKWEEYLSLPEEEREKLKQQVDSKPVPKPGRPAATPALSAPAVLAVPSPALPGIETAQSAVAPTTAEPSTKP
jgi:hypothetical protein